MSRNHSIETLCGNPLLQRGDELVSAQVPNGTTAEYLPAHIDLALRDYFEGGIRLEDKKIISLMREEGLQDEEILDTPLHISAGSAEHFAADARYFTRGQYFPQSNPEGPKLSIYPSTIVADERNSLTRFLQMNPHARVAVVADDPSTLTQSLSDTIRHEIRHMKQDVVEDQFDNPPLTVALTKRTREIGRFATFVSAGLGSSLAVITPITELLPKSQSLPLSILSTSVILGYANHWIKKRGQKWEMQDYFKDPREVDARSVESSNQPHLINMTIRPELRSMAREELRPDQETTSRRELFQGIGAYISNL